MKYKLFVLIATLIFISLPMFSQNSETETKPAVESEIEIQEQSEETQESESESKKKKIRIRPEVLTDSDQELFPNIPNPFYEEGADTSYDEEPITFLGMNARWLSDKLPNHSLKHIFSFDLTYTLTGWRNNGWGIGMNYEQKIWRYFSVKGQIGTTTTQISNSSDWCTGIRTDLTVFCYPFGKGLEWLYVGCGYGADFLFYNTEDTSSASYDILTCLIPTIGWKQIYFKKFMTDINVGYRFIITNTEHFEDNEDLITSGIQVGFKIKVFWNQILKSLVDMRIKKVTKQRKASREQNQE